MSESSNAALAKADEGSTEHETLVLILRELRMRASSERAVSEEFRQTLRESQACLARDLLQLRESFRKS